MFSGATSFNQDIRYWNVSKATNMSDMSNGATSFGQDIGYWNISQVTTMSGMLSNASLSTANYDALLKGWASLTVKNGVPFDAGNSKYTIASAAAAARTTLTTTYTWTIHDGGPL
jgi:surface protein